MTATPRTTTPARPAAAQLWRAAAAPPLHVSEAGELVCWGSNEGGYFDQDLPEILPERL